MCIRDRGIHDKIKPLLKSATASFGITALNELQELYNKTSLVEDGEFALEVMEHINEKVAQFKEEDGHLYALYGTPAENLCGLQVKQFRKKYGIIENAVSYTHLDVYKRQALCSLRFMPRGRSLTYLSILG